MAKTKISEWSVTPASNTDIDGINIAEGCAPSGINDAIREMMAQVKDLYSGTTGDAIAIAGGGTGATTASAARTALGVAIGTDVLPVANPSYTGTLTGGVATLGTNVYDSGAIEIGRMGTGDRVALVDFVSSGTPGAVDFSARVIRNAGVNGSLEIKNTGSGDIALIPDTGASWNIRQNSSTSYGGSLRIGGAGGPPGGALDFIAESDVRWLARGGRLDCVNGANTAWQAGTFRGHSLRFMTANDLTRFEVRGDGYCFFDNGSGSRGASGYALTTPNNSVSNAIRASGYIEWTTDVGTIGTNYFVSDIRKKENITPCAFNSSELISKIEFIGFDWKLNSGNTGRVDVGVSAQQLQALDTRLVSELSDGSLMVNEPSLVTHMAKAIQEQQAIITALTARVEALETT